MMEINEDDARIILQMGDICDNEGIGPDDNDLKKRIFIAFPSLNPQPGMDLIE